VSRTEERKGSTQQGGAELQMVCRKLNIATGGDCGRHRQLMPFAIVVKGGEKYVIAINDKGGDY